MIYKRHVIRIPMHTLYIRRHTPAILTYIVPILTSYGRLCGTLDVYFYISIQKLVYIIIMLYARGALLARFVLREQLANIYVLRPTLDVN